MRRGLYAGLIAGAIAGIIPLVSSYVYSIMGIYEPWIAGINYLIRQIIIHIGINSIWGIIFGLIFAIFFDKIPGKGIKKGLLIGLIYCLFSVIRPTFFLLAYGDIIWGLAFILSGIIDKFVYGVIFVTLFRRGA